MFQTLLEPIAAHLYKTKQPLQRWSPISTLNMGVSIGLQWQHSWEGYVMKDLEYRGITLQAEPSSLRCVVEMRDQTAASATGMPPLRCRPRCQKITGFISGRIKCGLRINERLNTQHHLHKKQQAGYVGGLVYFNLNTQSEGDAWSKKVWREAHNAVKEHFSA